MARGLILGATRAASPGSEQLEALTKWVEQNRVWITGLDAKQAAKLKTAALIDAVANAAPVADAVRPQPMLLADALADLLALDPFDRALLTVLIAMDRVPRIATLARAVTANDGDILSLIGALIGVPPHDAERRVRASVLLRLGLFEMQFTKSGQVRVYVLWTLERLLDRMPETADAMVDVLVGTSQPAQLMLEDFPGVAEDADFLVRLIAGALRSREAGINILLHGPPGTGKTELARTLAGTAGAVLRAVGEADDEGGEPARYERVGALRVAQRVLARASGTVLLFDEMEDLIGDAQPSSGDFFSRRQGSKVFVNRMLETNPLPVIWTTNALGNVDPAILRRMSFVLKLDLPSRSAGRRMLARVSDEEAVDAAAFEPLLNRAPETATVLRVAARAGRLAGSAEDSARAATTLVRALRGGTLPDDGIGDLDLDLFESDPAIAPLIARLVANDARDVSILLSGPPGTGKTALAHHFARALDRPLLVKRSSDLLSSWVGATEGNIAEAFAEARRREAVLFFDEVDSLLFDRTTARTSWEVTQVNELLTWLDRHPLPLIAATNHAARLDPATLRRFVFKLELQPLGRDRAASAFERFFGMAAPAALGELTGLTPGDFAVVARQIRHLGNLPASAIVERLRAETDVKPSGTILGFAAPMLG